MFLVDFTGTYLQNVAECDMIKNTTKNGLNVVFKPFLLVNHRGFEPRTT